MSLHPDIEALGEMCRRRRKGLPVDRWFDGDVGAHAAAKGAERAIAALARMIEEDRRRSLEAVEPWKDPARE